MQRREFIGGGLSLFAIAAAGRAFGAAAASNRVRVAMMGCHARGRGFQLMQRALEIPGVEIAVVCDVDSRAREAAAAKVFEKSGVKPRLEKDIRKVLEDRDIDAIICAAPDHMHAWTAAMAMRCGKAIYVEKPCTFSASECAILRRVQKETGVVFQMGSQRRSATVTHEVLKVIRAGEIGEVNFARTWYQNARKPLAKGNVTQPPEWLDWDLWQGTCPRSPYRDNVVHYNWHWTRRWGTGECPNNATHFIDIARWAMGLGLPDRVSSAGGKFYHRDTPDWEWPNVQHVSWSFPEGKLITWEGQSAVTYPKPFESWSGCHLLGTKGSVLFGPADATLFDGKGEVVKHWDGVGTGDNGKTSLTNPTDVADHEHMVNFFAAVRAADPALANQPVESSTDSTLLVHLGNIAQLTGETLKVDVKTGTLAPGSAGAEFWGREYEKGWELV